MHPRNGHCADSQCVAKCMSPNWTEPLVSLGICIVKCTAPNPSLGKSHRMHSTPTCICLCRLKTIRFFANRMSQWTADLTPSQQHHFRDAYEAELCARQAFQPILIGFPSCLPAYTSGLLRDKSANKIESASTARFLCCNGLHLCQPIWSCAFLFCRVSRKTTLDEDLLVRVPHPQAVSLADTIIKAGIHQYPESEFLLIVQTGLRIYLKNDKPVRCCACCSLETFC